MTSDYQVQTRIDLAGLAERFGTPLYVYDLDAAIARIEQLRAGLPECVEVYYAMKANSNRRLLGLLRPHVSGLDLSSGGELKLALACDYPAAQMSFAGPGKGDEELRAALDADLGVLSVESPTELERLEALAQRMGTRARITLRINPNSIPNAFMMKMGGRPSQFGIAEEDVSAPLRRAKESPHIELLGLHIYSGTQCLDIDAIVENIGQTLSISARLAEEVGFEPSLLNLGGGFGVAYFPGQEPLDNVALARAVGQVIEDAVAQRPLFANTRFILELGRYLIGPFGTYLARVIDVKQTRGKRFAIMDGGMNHCFPATGNFGQLVKKNYRVSNISGADRPQQAHELVGPLCTPLDSMGRAVQLGEAEVGDLVAFHSCGAYSFSASPILFLSHDTPAEIVLHEGRLEMARKPMSAADLL